MTAVVEQHDITRAQSSDMSHAEFMRIAHSSKPSEADLADLRRFLKARPEKLDTTLSFATQALNRLIDTAYDDQPATAVILKENCSRLRQRLGWESASPLEQLLIEQCVLSWVRVQHLEIVVSTLQAHHGSSPIQLTTWTRLLDSAQRRHLRAIETLARIRALAVRTPAILQVNVAQQQVITGPSSPPEHVALPLPSAG